MDKQTPLLDELEFDYTDVAAERDAFSVMCDDLATFLGSALGQLKHHNPAVRETPWFIGAVGLLDKYTRMTKNVGGGDDDASS